MYQIKYKKSVDKELRIIPAQTRKLIASKILRLANEPRPNGVSKIRGSDNLYRLRSGEYRVIYRIEDNDLTILIIKIGHRREIYQDF